MSMIFVGALILAGIWYFDGHYEPKRNLFDFIFLPVLLVWLSYRQVHREQTKWDSLVLELRSDSLVRRLPDFPLLEITPGDVTAIMDSSRGVTIKTNSRLKSLFIDKGLLDFDDFRNRLSAWAPMAKVVRTAPSIWKFVINIASTLVCMVIFGGPFYLMYTPHRGLILPLSLGLFIVFAATLLYYRHSPYIPINVKFSMWILLLLPLLPVITRVILN